MLKQPHFAMMLWKSVQFFISQTSGDLAVALVISDDFWISETAVTIFIRRE